MKTGDKLPELLGYDQNGNEITLSQMRGKKFILYTYPKDNTPGCTAEACSLRDSYDEGRGAGDAAVGASKDGAARHQRSAEKHALPSPLIADVDTRLLQEIGAWGEKTMCGRKTVGTLRTTFLVDEEGRIERIFSPKEIKTKTHAAQILQDMQ